MFDRHDIQESGSVALSRMVIGRAEKDLELFLQGLHELEPAWDALGWDWEMTIEGFVVAIEGALELGVTDGVARWLSRIDSGSPAEITPYLRAQRARFAGVLAARNGDGSAAERSLKRAAGAFRELGNPFPLGQALLVHAEILHDVGDPTRARPLLEEAQDIFSRLKATPWIERTQSALERALAVEAH